MCLMCMHAVCNPPPPLPSLVSYPHIMAFVDTQFPPLASEEPDGGCSEEFSSFNYWKVPIPSDIPLQLP